MQDRGLAPAPHIPTQVQLALGELLEHARLRHIPHLELCRAVEDDAVRAVLGVVQQENHSLVEI